MGTVWITAGSPAVSGCAKEAPADSETNLQGNEEPRVPSAAEVVERPGAVREFKEDIHLAMKKKAVQTALEVAGISSPTAQPITPDTFETLWKSIPTTERQSKSAEELKALMMRMAQSK